MRPVRLARVSNPYGRPGPYAAGVHTGVDFAATWGTSIFKRWIRSVDAGVVISAGYDDSYGWWCVVRSKEGPHGDNYVHGYCHMANRPRVRAGNRVKRGEILGRVGTSGNSTGYHLHYFENPGSTYSYSSHRKPRHCWGRTWPRLRAWLRRGRKR